MIPFFFPLLKTDSSVEELLGSDDGTLRVYRDIAQENAVAPYIVWSIVGGAPENVIEGRPTSDATRVQFEAWGTTESSSDEVYLAARNALELDGYVASFNGTGFDKDKREYFVAWDMTFRPSR